MGTTLFLVLGGYFGLRVLREPSPINVNVAPQGAELDYLQAARRVVTKCGQNIELLMVIMGQTDQVDTYTFRGDCGGSDTQMSTSTLKGNYL